MGRRNYKVGQAVKVVYQAPGCASGLTDVTMQIYDETGVLDATDYPDVTLTEVDTTGRYRGEFTPDAEGEWEVHVAYNSGTEGKVVSQYSVGQYHLSQIGGMVTQIESDVEAIDSPPMIG